MEREDAKDLAARIEAECKRLLGRGQGNIVYDVAETFLEDVITLCSAITKEQ